MSPLHRAALLLALAFAGGCSSKSNDTSPSGKPTPSAPRPPSAAPSTASAAPGPHTPPAHAAPKGTIAGAAFTPTIVMMLRDSDGLQLGFYQLTKTRERWKCEEPLGDTAAKLEARANADWVIGAPVETPLSNWTAWNGSKSATEGTARVTVTKRDEKTFTFAGTIEVKSPDGSTAFAGPFEGEYCPTKLVAREKPDPVNGAEWTADAFAADKLPATPIQSIFAGSPAPITHAVIRTVRGRSGPEEELLFYRDKLDDPCMPREDGGWLTSYGASNQITSRRGAKVRADYFAIYLAKAPSKGDAITGLVSSEKRQSDAIRSASLHVFEDDAYRSFIYDQYFTAALAFDEADASHAVGRVYLALPDKGRSMLVGAFDAKRCPEDKD